MKNIIVIVFLLFICACKIRTNDHYQSIIDDCGKKIELSFDDLHGEINAKDNAVDAKLNAGLSGIPVNVWGSGFFSGTLWMMYELTGDDKWLAHAKQSTITLEPEKWGRRPHEIGTKMFCSFGKALYYYPYNAHYREVLIQSAKTLSNHFNTAVGCIGVWNLNGRLNNFQVRIEHLMSVELLFWAAEQTGNENFYLIALTHAQTTLKNHLDKENSVYQAVNYYPNTGKVRNKEYILYPNSNLLKSRAQSIALYGFTMVYRKTGNKEFLLQAERIGNTMLNQTLSYQLDASSPNSNVHVNNSLTLDKVSSAILASAFYELGHYTNNKAKYVTAADKVLDLFASHSDEELYTGKLSALNPEKYENTEMKYYADYYLLEAILRKKNNGIH